MVLNHHHLTIYRFITSVVIEDIIQLDLTLKPFFMTQGIIDYGIDKWLHTMAFLSQLYRRFILIHPISVDVIYSPFPKVNDVLTDVWGLQTLALIISTRDIFAVVLQAKLTSQWSHNGRDCVSNHQPHDCLLNRLFGSRSKKTAKLRVTGLCVGSSPGPVNSPHTWPVTRKIFPFDDVIMNLIAKCTMKQLKVD